MEAGEAQKRLGDALFLDVREPYEFEAGHIGGSIHIPLMQLSERFAEIPQDRTVITVCQVGQRSELAATFLTEQGFDAHNLEGGMAEWQALGIPLNSANGKGQIVEGYARDLNGLL